MDDTTREAQREAALGLIDVTARSVAAQLAGALAAVNHVPDINFARLRIEGALDQLPTGRPVGDDDDPHGIIEALSAVRDGTLDGDALTERFRQAAAPMVEAAHHLARAQPAAR